ncbi:MAG TPA: hypothetical protein VF449_01045 [Parvibaculum sp.]
MHHIDGSGENFPFDAPARHDFQSPEFAAINDEAMPGRLSLPNTIRQRREIGVRQINQVAAMEPACCGFGGAVHGRTKFALDKCGKQIRQLLQAHHSQVERRSNMTDRLRFVNPGATSVLFGGRVKNKSFWMIADFDLAGRTRRSLPLCSL